MSIRKVFAWIIVLVLMSVACKAISIATSTTEPTASPVPPPTDTAVVFESTPTQPPPPAESPTPGKGSPPVIQSVDLRQETSGNEMTVYQDISFQDADGDANYLDYELVSATTEGIVIEDSPIDTLPEEQQSGAKITGTWNCGQDNYEVKLSVIVADEQGNESEAYEYTVVCGLGNVQASFPDLFDNNRNGWDVSGKFSIQNGQLQFRDSPSDAAYWVYCNGCIVTPDQDSVSVEASWSNTADLALGLLVDHKICTPDGMMFVISPSGYYSIQQAVHDASGEWSHWRPLIDWTPSSLIHKGLNKPNLLKAQYEFGSEDLHVGFYINGSYVNRVEVFGYNGARQCGPGLYSDSGLDANFDNFSIPAAK